MDRIDLGDARARIDELIERAEAGETVEITRDGKAVVRLSGIERVLKPIDIERLRRLTSTMREQPIESGEFVRQMRDSDRY